MKLKDIPNIAIGDIYYVQSKYDCKSCFKVMVLQIIDERTVLVEGMTKKKKNGKTAKPFKISVHKLHKTPDKAVSGYKQHH